MHDLEKNKKYAVQVGWPMFSRSLSTNSWGAGNKHVFEEMGVKFVQIVNLTPVIALVQ